MKVYGIFDGQIHTTEEAIESGFPSAVEAQWALDSYGWNTDPNMHVHAVERPAMCYVDVRLIDGSPASVTLRELLRLRMLSDLQLENRMYDPTSITSAYLAVAD